MLPRPYYCEKCHKTFRTPSGREWHIAHLHDAPATLQSIRTEYSARTDKLMADNRALESKNERMWFEQSFERLRFLGEGVKAFKLSSELLKENRRLEHEKNAAILALVFLSQGYGQPGTKPPGGGQGVVVSPLPQLDLPNK